MAVAFGDENGARDMIFTPNAAGIFAWDLKTDLIYGDPVIASLFGFEQAEILKGFRITDFISRMHAEDQPRVARSIRDAIISGRQYQEHYRIVRPDKTTVEVMALGRCFRDRDDVPVQYAGMIFSDMATDPSSDQDVMESSYRMAHAASLKANHHQVQMVLEKILLELGQPVVPAGDAGTRH